MAHIEHWGTGECVVSARGTVSGQGVIVDSSVKGGVNDGP